MKIIFYLLFLYNLKNIYNKIEIKTLKKNKKKTVFL